MIGLNTHELSGAMSKKTGANSFRNALDFRVNNDGSVRMNLVVSSSETASGGPNARNLAPMEGFA